MSYFHSGVVGLTSALVEMVVNGGHIVLIDYGISAVTVINYLMEKYGGTVENTVMIGDRLCDLESGYNAGCKTIFLVTITPSDYTK